MLKNCYINFLHNLNASKITSSIFKYLYNPNQPHKKTEKFSAFLFIELLNLPYQNLLQ